MSGNRVQFGEPVTLRVPASIENWLFEVSRDPVVGWLRVVIVGWVVVGAGSAGPPSRTAASHVSPPRPTAASRPCGPPTNPLCETSHDVSYAWVALTAHHLQPPSDRHESAGGRRLRTGSVKRRSFKITIRNQFQPGSRVMPRHPYPTATTHFYMALAFGLWSRK
jgi:hypothetical protein